MSAIRFVVMVAAVSAGCSARYACQEGSSEGLPSDPVSSSSIVEDSFRASAVGDAQTWKFRATLSGLPELWPASGAILDNAFRTSVSLVYETPPLGGDGHTEMPRVQVSFPNLHHAGAGFSGITRPLHGPQPDTFGTIPFVACGPEASSQCCPFGSRECAVDISLKLERVDGAPFPPVTVHFSAQASAETSSCPLEREEPALSLERMDP